MLNMNVVKEREDRHRKLMRLIKNYRRNDEEANRLERIKDNTVLEINLRFLRSEHNKYYVFPKKANDSDDDSEQVDPFDDRKSQTYDLKEQNEVSLAVSHKSNDYERGKRIKSLDREKNDDFNERLGRLEVNKGGLSMKRLKRKSVGEVKRIFSTLKLPELHRKEKIKTECKLEDRSIEKIIGIKLNGDNNGKYEIRNLEKKKSDRGLVGKRVQ